MMSNGLCTLVRIMYDGGGQQSARLRSVRLMIRRQYYRPLGLLLLVVPGWVAGPGAASHSHPHRGPSQRAAGGSAAHPPPASTLAAARTEREAPCPACTYMKAVRGAVTVPHFRPALS